MVPDSLTRILALVVVLFVGGVVEVLRGLSGGDRATLAHGVFLLIGVFVLRVSERRRLRRK